MNGSRKPLQLLPWFGIGRVIVMVHVVRIIEAAGIVAQKNYEYHQRNHGCPVSAVLEGDGIAVVEP